MLAGMDVSGDPKSGNHRFMGIVIGTNESIKALTRRLGPEPVHMNRIVGRSAKYDIINKVNFDGINRMGLCIRLEKNRTFSSLRDRLKRESNPVTNKKMYRTYHALMWNLIRDRVEQFLRQHDFEVHRLAFQCDDDCKFFVHDQGWHRASPGSAHGLADVLAWANRRGIEPKGAVRLDISKPLEERMFKLFK